MNKSTLLTLLFAGLFGIMAHAQGFAQLGTQFVEDQGNRLIATSDGGYITAGKAGTNAVLYRTDCLGNLVAKIEKEVTPGPAVFWDVIELADGNIVAVGGASVLSPTDTGNQVFLLKTTPTLVEIASSSFSIFNKESLGKSITQTPSGQLLVFGEYSGDSTEFSNVFFQSVALATLLPTADPLSGNIGVDQASRIMPTADGNYLLTGTSYAGNIADPNATVANVLWAFKLDENGALLWQTTVQQSFLAKYGVIKSCGAVQNSQSGNFVLGGNLYNGSDLNKQDAFFALVSNDGVVLDTVYSDGPEQQRMYAIVENSAAPGLYAMIGDGDGSPLGVPSPVFTQAYELADQLYTAPASLDVNTPISLRDLAELDPGRFAFMATLPDNPIVLGATDIIISTPEVTAGIVYQNCALAATLSGPAVAFQWLYEGQPIPGANQGVYFPDAPGLYQVQVLDSKGCYGVSDTFRLSGPTAGFSFTPDNLTVTFTDTSTVVSSYFWIFGDGENSTQQNPIHTYAANGVYTVTLIVEDLCGFYDTIQQQIGVVSAQEPSWLQHFSLSPNPTSGNFTLEMSGEPQEKVAFALLNQVGQMAIREEHSFQNGWLQKTFDLSQLPAGIYTLQIRSGKEAKNVRVVKR